MEAKIVQSKTKSGKSVQVAVIPLASVIGEGLEREHWIATEIAQRMGCTHYRVVRENGSLHSSGKVGALPSYEQIAGQWGDRSE